MFSMITEGGPVNFLDIALMTFGNVRDAHPTQTFAEYNYLERASNKN